MTDIIPVCRVCHDILVMGLHVGSGLRECEEVPAEVPQCPHNWAWVSPTGTNNVAHLCQKCHAPDADWLNSIVEIKQDSKHKWPMDDDHVLTKWQTYKGLPESIDYRTCIHPECKFVEYRDTPKG